MLLAVTPTNQQTRLIGRLRDLEAEIGKASPIHCGADLGVRLVQIAGGANIASKEHMLLTLRTAGIPRPEFAIITPRDLPPISLGRDVFIKSLDERASKFSVHGGGGLLRLSALRGIQGATLDASDTAGEQWATKVLARCATIEQERPGELLLCGATYEALLAQIIKHYPTNRLVIERALALPIINRDYSAWELRYILEAAAPGKLPTISACYGKIGRGSFCNLSTGNEPVAADFVFADLYHQRGGTRTSRSANSSRGWQDEASPVEDLCRQTWKAWMSMLSSQYRSAAAVLGVPLVDPLLFPKRMAVDVLAEVDAKTGRYQWHVMECLPYAMGLDGLRAIDPQRFEKILLRREATQEQEVTVAKSFLAALISKHTKARR